MAVFSVLGSCLLLLLKLSSSHETTRLGEKPMYIEEVHPMNVGRGDIYEQRFSLRSAFFHNFTREHDSLNIFALTPKTKAFFKSSHNTNELFDSLYVRPRSMAIQIPVTPTNGWSYDQDPVLAVTYDPQKNVEWRTEAIVGPNVTDKTTVINLAKMTSDAYIIDPSQPDWINISPHFNQSASFGWEDDGLRGHIFTDSTNETVIIAFKGTSVDPRNKWATNDRLNDNILFSCCCATQRPDPYLYGPVCDCRTEEYRCNSTCLSQEVSRRDLYYVAAVEVYLNVSATYPDSQIWVTGHSMGGAMASLIGLTFNIPAVTFESLPQALPAQRLGLSIAPNPRLTGAYHFGHTADPVFMGACNGYFSSCSIGGYAFESQCFTGQRCEYDTVGDKGWRMSINTHRINNVISNVLEAYDTVASCTLDEECAECNNWYFDLDPK